MVVAGYELPRKSRTHHRPVTAWRGPSRGGNTLLLTAVIKSAIFYTLSIAFPDV